jgi:hypothetical protein
MLLNLDLDIVRSEPCYQLLTFVEVNIDQLLTFYEVSMLY